MIVRLRDFDAETFVPTKLTLVDCGGEPCERIADTMAALELRFEAEGDVWRVGLTTLSDRRIVLVIVRTRTAQAAARRSLDTTRRNEAAGELLH